MAIIKSLDDSEEVNKVIPKPQEKLLGKDIKKAVKIVDRILSSSDKQIRSRRFLLDAFNEYGIPRMEPDFFKPYRKIMNKSGFGALQVPTEIVDCLIRIIPLNIKSAVEIGVYRGGLSYFLAAVLQRICPDFKLTMIDPWDSLLGYEEFSKRLNLINVIPSTSDNFIGKSFDFVFIDGDHMFEGAMKDFYNLGRYAKKAIAFHDIHDHTPGTGTVRAWNEIKLEMVNKHEVYEIAHSVDRGLGIGLVII